MLYDESKFHNNPDCLVCRMLNNDIDVKPAEKLTDVQKFIVTICDEIKELLLEKNRKYGNSALEPVRVFSSSSPAEQLKVRIDDKLSRIVNSQEDEDVLNDLLGYIILLKVYNRKYENI